VLPKDVEASLRIEALRILVLYPESELSNCGQTLLFRFRSDELHCENVATLDIRVQSRIEAALFRSSSARIKVTYVRVHCIEWELQRLRLEWRSAHLSHCLRCLLVDFFSVPVKSQFASHQPFHRQHHFHPTDITSDVNVRHMPFPLLVFHGYASWRPIP
jgi:hypothetical protein